MFGRVGVAGRGEGGCEGANGVVSGLDVLKVNVLMNKKGPFSPKKHPLLMYRGGSVPYINSTLYVPYMFPIVPYMFLMYPMYIY